MKYLTLLTTVLLISLTATGGEMKKPRIKLSQPKLVGKVSLEETLAGRHSLREFADATLTLEEVSQLLWSAQGITREDFYRTAPSAGALYPLEVYVVADKVQGLTPGLYHYLPQGHQIELLKEGRLLKTLAGAALGQEAIYDCSSAFIIAGVVKRTAKKYEERAERYVLIEVGHAGQNLLLQAQALKMGAVPMGAFYDGKVKSAFGLEGNPYYIIPVGRREK